MSKSPITTHILDTAAGRPAAGVDVVLELQTAEGWRKIGQDQTNLDGRAAALATAPIVAGYYRLSFETGAYFDAQGGDCFHPSVTITFAVESPGEHYHVPLLISPFGYTTYRGS